MNTILVYEDQRGLHEYNSNLNTAAEQCNELAARFNSLPLRNIDSVAKLKELLESETVEAFVATMLPETPTIFGMKVNATKAIDLLDLDLKPLKHGWQETHKGHGVEFCNVAKLTRGKFEVDPAKLAQVIEKRFRRYATTSGEVTVHNAIQQIKKSFDVLAGFGLRWDEVTKLYNFSPSWPDKELTLHTGTFNQLAEAANRKT